MKYQKLNTCDDCKDCMTCEKAGVAIPKGCPIPDMPSRAAIAKLVKTSLRYAPFLAYAESSELGQAAEKAKRQLEGKKR